MPYAMPPEFETHSAIIQLIIAYTFIGGLIFTMVITCLSLIGLVTFSNKSQQNKLFGLLIVEFSIVSIGSASNFLIFDPKTAQNAAIKDALQITRSSPVISDVKLNNVETEDGRFVKQLVSFSDPEGDARTINWIILGSNLADGIESRSGPISASTLTQQSGATTTGTWHCGKQKYWVKIAAIISDEEGNVSRPYDFTIDC